MQKGELSLFAIIKDIAIGIGLALLVAMTMWQGLETFIKSPLAPSYDAVYKLETELRDLKLKGTKEEVLKVKEQLKKAKEVFETEKIRYEEEKNIHARTSLVTGITIGLIIAVTGTFFEAEFLSIGLLMGGILGISSILMKFRWYKISDVVRFVIFFGLLLLIFFLEYILFLRTERK